MLLSKIYFWSFLYLGKKFNVVYVANFIFLSDDELGGVSHHQTYHIIIY